MAIKLRNYSKVLNAVMYRDTFTLSRMGEPKKDKYGATISAEREVIYEDKPCKFSFTNIDQPTDGNDVYVPVLKEVKVFTDLDYDIKSGDLIRGERLDDKTGVTQVIEGICGEPNRYDYHQEITLQLDKDS